MNDLPMLISLISLLIFIHIALGSESLKGTRIYRVITGCFYLTSLLIIIAVAIESTQYLANLS